MIKVTDYWFIKVVTVTDIDFGVTNRWDLTDSKWDCIVWDQVSRPVSIIIYISESYWENIVRS